LKKKTIEDLIKKNTANEALDNTLHEEHIIDSPKENPESKNHELHSAEMTKSQLLKNNQTFISQRNSVESYGKESANRKEEQGYDIKPILINIERDNEKRQSEKEKGAILDDEINTVRPISIEYSPGTKSTRINSKLTGGDKDNGHSSPHKQSSNHQITIEIEQDPEDKSIRNKLKSTNNTQKHEQRILSYSIEREKHEFTPSNRSGRTPILTDLKTNNLMLPSLDSHRFQDSAPRVDVKKDDPQSNDIVIETFRGSIVSVSH